MPTMNIKDPEVHRMAHQLAAQRNTTATGAVRDALREALDRDRAVQLARVGMADRLLAVAAESQAIEGPLLADDDLYDERGLPR